MTINHSFINKSPILTIHNGNKLSLIATWTKKVIRDIS